MLMKTKLQKRFETGLKEHNLTFDEVKTWKYDGGDWDYHLNNWKRKYGNEPTPEKKSKCLCGQIIDNNCYITNGIQRLVVGSCCIKKFIDSGFKRFCSCCEVPIKSLKDNYCLKCRKTILEKQKNKKAIMEFNKAIMGINNTVYQETDPIDNFLEKSKIDNTTKHIFAKNEYSNKQNQKIALNKLFKKRIYLNVKYSEKDICKGFGGRWDPDVKKWYIEEDCQDIDLFKKWM